jgi:hypothetical protein
MTAPRIGYLPSAPAQQAHQNGSSRLSEDVKLSLPQLNRLRAAYLQRGQNQTAPSQSTSSQQNSTPTLIPTQRSVCRQIIKKWGPYAEARDKSNSSRHKEQLSLHCPQKIAATDDNSALCEEMRALEPEAENAQPRTLCWAPLGFLGTIGPGHHADSWHLSLWQTYFCSTIGERVPVLVTVPTQTHPEATCGCNKFVLLDLHRSTAITLAHVKVTQVLPNRTIGWLPSLVLSSGPPGTRLRHRELPLARV